MFCVTDSNGAVIRRYDDRESADRVASRYPELYVKETIAKEQSHCQYRGTTLRAEQCPTCSGHVAVKVFACALHGECQLGAKLQSVRSCDGCRDFRAMSNTPSQRAEPPPRRDVSSEPLCRVTVAIICHNYGRFLRDCLSSIAAQTQVLHQVFVVDDSSTDETQSVCRELGVTVIRGEWRDVFLARKAAYEHATGDVICFLDADDMLTANYIADGCRFFDDPTVGVVYSDVEHFGNQSGRTSYPEFSRDELWRENFIHAGSLVRRDAIRSTSAFDQTDGVVNTHADWTLWKRVLRESSGWRAIKQSAMYRYRKHGTNMLQTTKSASYFDRADLQREPVTLFVPLSGREELWERFSNQLAKLTWPRKITTLILFDTSQSNRFSGLVGDWIRRNEFLDVRHVRATVGSPRIADADRRQSTGVVTEVRQAVARIYNWLRANVATQYVMVLEDDVFPNRDDVIEQLLRGFDEHTSSVSGAYRSAYGRAFVAWSEVFTNGQPKYREVPDVGLQPTIGNGFGCVMLRRSLIRDVRFADMPHLPSKTTSADYDVEFYTRLRMAGRDLAKLDWSIQCDHVSRV